MVDTVLRWFAPELNVVDRVQSRGEASGSFQATDLNWASDTRFRDLPFSSQRVALFLRAIVKKPDLVVLDEAFSGMDEYVRDKCMLFLECGQTRYYGQDGSNYGPLPKREVVATEAEVLGNGFINGLSNDQALICVSHLKEEVPDVVREWMCLPEADEGRPARFGRLERPLDGDSKTWIEIWGM